MTKITNFFNKNQKKFLWFFIIFYFIAFSLICIWKYYQFGYNGLDLAIFNQVFYNSAQGNLFQFTIHPGLYLGDHFALIIPLLLPFYLPFQHPINLLILQSLILALSAWPIFLIAKNVLSAKVWPLIIALAWLLNPFVHNINLFEFHLLPFAIFFLLFTFYFYQKKNFLAFLLFGVLALLVREDVSLVFFMFSILALFERRKLKWILAPALVSILWFLMAIKFTSYFTPSGNYKFLYYYSWLGQSPSEMFINFFAYPLNTLKHVFSFNNILFTLTMLLPFTFLNLIKSRYLLLALPIFLQIILGGSSNSTIALKLHYTSLFLPALFISLIYGLKQLLSPDNNKRHLIFLNKYKKLVIIILTVATVYTCLTLGPVVPLVKAIANADNLQEFNQLRSEFVKTISKNESLVATYDFLTPLSGREKVYSHHYTFIGKMQFTDINYQPPEDVETFLVNYDDLLTYAVQFPNSSQWQAYYKEGDNNLRKLIQERNLKVNKIADSYVLLTKNGNPDINLFQKEKQFSNIKNKQITNIDNKIEFLGWSPITNYSLPITHYQLLPISLYFKALNELDENYQLKLSVKNKNGQIVHSKLYPLAYGLYPTSDWQTNEVIKINYWFLMPEKLPKDDYIIELELLSYKGYLTLDGIRSTVIKITKEEVLKPSIQLTNYFHH